MTDSQARMLAMAILTSAGAMTVGLGSIAAATHNAYGGFAVFIGGASFLFAGVFFALEYFTVFDSEPSETPASSTAPANAYPNETPSA